MSDAVIEVLGDPPTHLIRAWAPEDAWHGDDGKPGYAEFAVYEVRGWDASEDGVPCGWGPQSLLFRCRGDEGDTGDLDAAIRTAHGSVKWDGCVNYVVSEDEGLGFESMLHACGPDSMRNLMAAVLRGYEMAAAITVVDDVKE